MGETPLSDENDEQVRTIEFSIGEDDVELSSEVDLDADEFLDRLASINEASESLSALAEDLDSLRRTGLDDEDVVSLLFGRNHGLNKGTVRKVLLSIDEVRTDASGSTSDRRDLLVRLVADASDSTLSETEAVFQELDRLAEKYSDEL